MAGPAPVTRRQVLGHRVIRQDLHRPGTEVRDLDVWALGVQDAPAGNAALALAARLPGGIDDVPDLADARSFTSVWATRGAPVVVRTGDLAAFAAALWPIDGADAVKRLAGNGQALRAAGVDPIEAIRVTAEALRAVVTGSDRDQLTKGEVSEAVSPLLPEEYITWCRPCQAHHLGDQLMRVAALAAGLRLVPGASPATLAAVSRWSGVPEEASGTVDLVRAYLGLAGPATPADVAAYLQTTATVVKAHWPDDAVPVVVDGRKAWLPEGDLAHLLDPPEPDHVRLLPRSDPWLLARDRELTVPDAATRKVLWPVLGWPGAVLVDGEVVAAWRTRASGTKLTITVEAFSRLARSVRTAVEHEAQGVATQRGATDLTVTHT